MKNKTLIAVILLLLLPLLLAMGALQKESPEKIPVPKKKFVATFIDQTDVITECQEVSIGGETFLEGRKGSGTTAIPFDNFKEISFLYEGQNLQGLVKMQDGNTIQLSLDKNQRAFGRTKYGTFQIRLGDLKKMTIARL